ncbi:hypothetical protein L6452_24076 [Arctium lappa]|uniref:Uncharacterized protein n=1 Tax=Arctium lappa TaxID=4217 RepID=A0ACB9A9V7_ARCLA|nr:hypothetical protein L6452_24076 [Arctium lappa]
MIWFHFSIVLLLCQNTSTILANSSSIANPTIDGNGAMNNKSCFHTEKQALLDFKAAIEDPDGRLLTWRGEDDDCCKWSGVTCNNQTPFHVTELHMGYNPFTGLRDLRGKMPLNRFSSSSFSLIFFFFIDFPVVVHRFASALLLQLIFIDLLLHRFSATVHRFASATVLLQPSLFWMMN